MCYVFHVEPSAGAMAKTIEAACKLRYQKVSLTINVIDLSMSGVGCLRIAPNGPSATSCWWVVFKCKGMFLVKLETECKSYLWCFNVYVWTLIWCLYVKM